MGNPFTLQIFYPDGDPGNMRVADKMGWTGTVFYISRAYWSSGVEQYREELQSPGIYVLAGTKESIEENDDLQSIYIGCAESLLTRIDQHMSDPDKEFWESVVCVVGGASFNNAHFKWMESDLIQQAKENDRCFLKNRTTPNKVHMSMAAIVGIKQFLKETLQILPVLEIDAFVAPKILSSPPTTIKLTKELAQGGFDHKVKMKKLRQKVLTAFQNRENVNLLKRSLATFYDESKTLHVCCGIAKNSSKDNQGKYWFGPSKMWFNFLESGTKSYLLFGMEGQSKAVMLPFSKFKDIKDELLLTKKNGAGWWHVTIKQNDGKLFIRLKGGGKFDVSPFLLDID